MNILYREEYNCRTIETSSKQLIEKKKEVSIHSREDQQHDSLWSNMI